MALSILGDPLPGHGNPLNSQFGRAWNGETQRYHIQMEWLLKRQKAKEDGLIVGFAFIWRIIFTESWYAQLLPSPNTAAGNHSVVWTYELDDDVN